ncbi:MAG: nhaA [Caulobacteraceae bacterium]|nr:nhaA [Caulobacteraceae bacterium]
MARRPTLEFLNTEAASGLILGGAALAALILANSPWSDSYFGFIHTPFTLQVGAFHETAEVLDWVKQGLMAIFFFVVGMEIKFEILKGELANPRRLAMPALAALGGMAMPALIYLAFNAGQPGARGGWAVPTATDIAFALGALAAVSKRLPASLRIFLLTLAIADDLGVVGLIAVLFSSNLHVWPLAGAGLALAGMAGLGRWRSAPFLFYAAGFALAWAFTLKSGMSTSVTGVLAALTVPIGPRRRGQDSVLRHFMDSLHPYVAFGILPLFAFVAAGFSFSGISGHLLAPITLGVLLGLFLGKQIGVFGAVLIAVLAGFGRKPTGATWLELYGVSLLCGVGFTMSLFIAALAFPDVDVDHQNQVRLGVVLASILSASLGMMVLAWAGGLRAKREAAGL